MLRIISISFFITLFGLGNAHGAILLNEHSIKITKQAQYLIDESNNLNLEQAAKQSGWKNINENRINFGFLDHPVWVKFSITTPNIEEWVLYVDYPLLDYIDVFALNGSDLVTSFETGDARAFHTRPIDHRNFAFPINISKHQTYDIYIRTSSKGATEFPLWIESKSTFDEAAKTHEFIRGWVNGILVIMLLYNLFIYIFTKENTYLFYVINVTVYVIQLSIYDGSGFQHFWSEHPEYNQYLFPFFNGLMQLTQFLFLVVFLDVLKRDKWFVKPVKNIIAILAVLPFLGLILDYHTIVPVQVILALVVNLSGIVFGIYFSLKGETSAKYFTVAWLLFLIGLVVTNLKSFGIVPNNVFTTYSYQIGAFIEMTLLSLALAQRIETAKSKIISLQNDNIAALEDYQNLYNHSLSGQFKCNKDGSLLSVNPAFNNMFNQNGKWENITDHGLGELFIEDCDSQFVFKKFNNRESIINHELQLLNNEGKPHWFNLTARPCIHQTEDSNNFDCSIVDINEKKEITELKEKALTERMNTLEQLAIGICHELNTPLGISITGISHLDVLAKEIKSAVDSGAITKKQLLDLISQESDSIDLVHTSLSRVSQLIKQFKQISVNQQGFQVEESTLSTIFQNLTLTNKDKLQAHELQLNTQEIPLKTYCKALESILNQLIENSVIHSFENIDNGIITISSKMENDHLIIDYQDNGTGILCEDKSELYNAFYTTKRGTHGRIGLGLYQVFNLVHQLLRGSIELLKEDHIHYVIKIPIDIKKGLLE